MTICVARSRGFEISYEDVGNGPAVVLVSGFAWPASSWAELGYIGVWWTLVTGCSPWIRWATV